MNVPRSRCSSSTSTQTKVGGTSSSDAEGHQQERAVREGCRQSARAHVRPEIFYAFTSPLYPLTVFRFDLASGNSTPFEAPTLTFDPSLYMTERVFAPSKDGTRVPLFITHRKGLKKDGANPTMLSGFGGFGISELLQFRPQVITFLERGGLYATANIRGGGEYGQPWHEAGTFEKKQNVFDDFIAAAEYLVREKYASPRRLGIMGGSNGGLLVGAVMEQRPDLFAVALPAVGVMDMLRFHRFTGGAVGTTEYGSAENAKDFAYLYKYSPLHNVTPGVCYPATLITTADHDDRVVPEPFVQVRRDASGGAGMRQSPCSSESRRRHRTPIGRPTNGSPNSPTSGRLRSPT
jgi:prolyl oligopeptidase